MLYCDRVLIITHVLYRKKPPYIPVEGPYSEDYDALKPIVKRIDNLQIPLTGYNDPILYGGYKNEKKLKVPNILGVISPVKYLIDVSIVFFFTAVYCLKNWKEKVVVIGIDPLSCLPLIFLKKIFKFKLIFHSVDFNRNRFTNRILQFFYEKADELSSKYSDQVWSICESLINYKKAKYNVKSYYLPHAPIYNSIFFEEGRKLRTGNKLAWTGALLTDRSFELLFSVLRDIQNNIRDDMEFYFAPTRDHKKFSDYGKKYRLKKFKVLNIHTRAQWQKFASTCDAGIAIYDDQFGSTEFIEPMKIWDYLLCGLPFIISCEPSISQPIKKAGVAYLLNKGNKIPNDNSLYQFLAPTNINKKQKACLGLAKKYDMGRQVRFRLSALCKPDEASNQQTFSEKQSSYWDSYNSSEKTIDLVNIPTAEKIELEYILKLLGNLHGKKILDLGCGPGKFSLKLAKRGKEIIGIDISRNAINIANKTARYYKINNFRGIVNDFKKPLYKDYFDIAIAINMIHHSDDTDVILKNVYHSLKAKGRLLIFEVNPLNPLFIPFLISCGQIKSHLTKEYLRSNIYSLKKLIRRNGLTIDQVNKWCLLPTSLYNYSLIFKTFNETLNKVPVINSFCAFHVLLCSKS